jgi:hypothetical protein
MRVFTYAVYVMLKNFILKNQKANLQYFHKKLKTKKRKTKEDVRHETLDNRRRGKKTCPLKGKI